MGFCKCHASLRKMGLPICESSAVYAMGLTTSFQWIGSEIAVWRTYPCGIDSTVVGCFGGPYLLRG